ncbi:MAG: hypothetical protein WC184_11590 [Acidimicrobiia bacterium]
MIVPSFLGCVSSPHVLDVAMRVLGENKDVVAKVAANPNVTVGVVEPFYERFKSAEVTRLLLSNSRDSGLVTFLLGRKERRVSVLQTALLNWFLPDELYLSVMGSLSSENAAVFVDAADGYTKQLKTRAARKLEPVDMVKWVVWDDTGFSDDELLQVCNLGSFYLGGGESVYRRAIEAVLFRRPHLINQLKMPYYPNLAALLAGLSVSEQVVANIIVSSLVRPEQFGKVWFTLLHNPWLPSSMFETVRAQMVLHLVRKHFDEQRELLRTEPVTWSELTQNFGEFWSFNNIWGGYLSPTLRHRVLLEILLDRELMANKQFVESLRLVFHNRFRYKVPLREWFPRKAVVALQDIVGVDQSMFSQRCSLHWGYEDKLPQAHGRGADRPVVWPQQFENVIASNVPIRRTAPVFFNNPDLLPVGLDWSHSTIDQLASEDKACDQAAWFETKLGDGTTPQSIMEWETLFQLLPGWEQTFGKLVETSKKLVSLQ